MTWRGYRARWFISVLALVLTLSIMTLPVQAQAQPLDTYIVMLHDNADVPVIARAHAARYGAEVTHHYATLLKGYAARLPAARLAQLKAEAAVQSVSLALPLVETAQTKPTGMDRIEADLSKTAKVNGIDTNERVNIDIAVIDSGVNTHTDLVVQAQVNCTNDADGKDGRGHGTHVAGIIAAKDNGSGVVGVAPGARIHSYKVINTAGAGDTTNLLCALDKIAQTNIKLVNMSLGYIGSTDDGNCGYTNGDVVHQTICTMAQTKDVVFVAAAGNDGKDLKDFMPAASDFVITVTAMNDNDGKPGGLDPTPPSFFLCLADADDTGTEFSNYTTSASPNDMNHVIAAPGTCIYSTSRSGSYTYMSGTSQAAPHVTGAVALCRVGGACPTTRTTDGPTVGQATFTKLSEDAKVRGLAYGFASDPHRPYPYGDYYYGYLVYAGGY